MKLSGVGKVWARWAEVEGHRRRELAVIWPNALVFQARKPRPRLPGVPKVSRGKGRKNIKE